MRCYWNSKLLQITAVGVGWIVEIWSEKGSDPDNRSRTIFNDLWSSNYFCGSRIKYWQIFSVWFRLWISGYYSRYESWITLQKVICLWIRETPEYDPQIISPSIMPTPDGINWDFPSSECVKSQFCWKWDENATSTKLLVNVNHCVCETVDLHGGNTCCQHVIVNIRKYKLV